MVFEVKKDELNRLLLTAQLRSVDPLRAVSDISRGFLNSGKDAINGGEQILVLIRFLEVFLDVEQITEKEKRSYYVYILHKIKESTYLEGSRFQYGAEDNFYKKISELFTHIYIKLGQENDKELYLLQEDNDSFLASIIPSLESGNIEVKDIIGKLHKVIMQVIDTNLRGDLLSYCESTKKSVEEVLVSCFCEKPAIEGIGSEEVKKQVLSGLNHYVKLFRENSLFCQVDVSFHNTIMFIEQNYSRKKECANIKDIIDRLISISGEGVLDNNDIKGIIRVEKVITNSAYISKSDRERVCDFYSKLKQGEPSLWEEVKREAVELDYLNASLIKVAEVRDELFPFVEKMNSLIRESSETLSTFFRREDVLGVVSDIKEVKKQLERSQEVSRPHGMRTRARTSRLPRGSTKAASAESVCVVAEESGRSLA